MTAALSSHDFSHSPSMERTVKVYQILFLVWGIVFAFWLVRQFSDHNERKGRK